MGGSAVLAIDSLCIQSIKWRSSPKPLFLSRRDLVQAHLHPTCTLPNREPGALHGVQGVRGTTKGALHSVLHLTCTFILAHSHVHTVVAVSASLQDGGASAMVSSELRYQTIPPSKKRHVASPALQPASHPRREAG
mmetsp:Transcript_104536/g.180115  ORF Transcript_104536/g.180115 Transcript_104536/m.180115 type:complete len:136 (+) Transcript_104536:138-545(+)